MNDAYVIGAYSTTFGKKPEISYKDLTTEVYRGTLADAGMEDGAEVVSTWFSNYGMYSVGQGGIRGQVCLTPLIESGEYPMFAPIINVENGCASGATAVLGAFRDVSSGAAHTSLALGVEKLVDERPGVDRFAVLEGGIDQLDPDDWREYYTAAATKAGKELTFAGNRSMFMDTYATQATYHMAKYGTTQRQLAVAAAKTHTFGADNPRAQYRFRMTPEEVLEDRLVSYPLTRSMCSPIGDGGAGLLLCSPEYLRSCPPEVQDRAVRVRACAMSSGRYRDLDDASMTAVAARRAYAAAGVDPGDIDVAEVHDATTFSEILQSEMMGFCDEGEGGRFIESGATHLGGSVPLNTSGGLVSKGHPIGATGISMLGELVIQLRAEAGPRQVDGAELALAENGGGIMGFDEAACVVTILERT